jgi:hypothetical protein
MRFRALRKASRHTDPLELGDGAGKPYRDRSSDYLSDIKVSVNSCKE